MWRTLIFFFFAAFLLEVELSPSKSLVLVPTYFAVHSTTASPGKSIHSGARFLGTNAHGYPAIGPAQGEFDPPEGADGDARPTSALQRRHSVLAYLSRLSLSHPEVVTPRMIHAIGTIVQPEEELPPSLEASFLPSSRPASGVYLCLSVCAHHCSLRITNTPIPILNSHTHVLGCGAPASVAWHTWGSHMCHLNCLSSGWPKTQDTTCWVVSRKCPPLGDRVTRRTTLTTCPTVWCQDPVLDMSRGWRLGPNLVSESDALLGATTHEDVMFPPCRPTPCCASCVRCCETTTSWT